MPQVAKRTLVGYLNDINALGVRLFESEGVGATEVLQELKHIRHALHRLEQKYTIINVLSGHADSLNGSELELNLSKDDRSIGLRKIINKVKSVEKTFDFQLKLHQEKRLLAEKTGVTDATFTYGTTSFDCFASLMDHNAMNGIHSIHEPKIGILGSSQGLLAYYTSYYFPHAKCIHGIEIMPCLHNLAQSLLAVDANSFNNVTFSLQDMLTHNLAGYDMIVLTSLCWDKETRQKVAYKLSSEIDRNCVVIDYRADSFSEFGLDQDNSYYTSSIVDKRRHADHIISKCDVELLSGILFDALLEANKQKVDGLRQPKRFKLAGLLEGDVSWNCNQRLYIYVTVA